MIDQELLKLLACPQDRSPLAVADQSLIEKLNQVIADGDIAVVNIGGRRLEEPLAGGLVRQDKTLLYPVDDDIPVLLADEAIPLEQIDG